MKTPIPCPNCGKLRELAPSAARQRRSMLCKTCTLVDRNQQRRIHGLERHPLYPMWTNMKARIDRPRGRNRGYAGLDIDPAWRDVRNFIAWAISAGWQPGLSIERRDNALGYWPANCHFIPTLHQARNRRDNSVTPQLAAQIQARVANGEVRYQVAKDVAANTGIPLSTIVKVAYGYNWA